MNADPEQRCSLYIVSNLYLLFFRSYARRPPAPIRAPGGPPSIRGRFPTRTLSVSPSLTPAVGALEGRSAAVPDCSSAPFPTRPAVILGLVRAAELLTLFFPLRLSVDVRLRVSRGPGIPVFPTILVTYRAVKGSGRDKIPALVSSNIAQPVIGHEYVSNIGPE